VAFWTPSRAIAPLEIVSSQPVQLIPEMVISVLTVSVISFELSLVVFPQATTNIKRTAQ
jgi:hypothetical protein